MEDTCCLSGFESGNDLENRINRFNWRKWSVLLDSVLQCPTWQQLHRDHRYSRDFLAAIDVDGVGVTHCSGELAFAQKSRAIRGIAQTLTQDLQGDAAPVLEVLGLVHLTHAATSEQSFDPIRPEPLARREARCGARRHMGRDSRR